MVNTHTCGDDGIAGIVRECSEAESGGGGGGGDAVRIVFTLTVKAASHCHSLVTVLQSCGDGASHPATALRRM